MYIGGIYTHVSKNVNKRKFPTKNYVPKNCTGAILGFLIF